MNDNWFAEAAPVDRGREHQRLRVAFAGLPPQIAADREMQRAAAVRACRLNFDRQLLFPQLPFDEGRRHGVLGSSAKDALAGAEPEAVRRHFRGYREGPRDSPAPVAHQKEQVSLQLIQNRVASARGEAQRAGDVRRLERSAGLDQFGHREVPDALMFRRHETQAPGHVPADATHFLAPGPGRDSLQQVASSKDNRLRHIYYDIVYYETVQTTYRHAVRVTESRAPRTRLRLPWPAPFLAACNMRLESALYYQLIEVNPQPLLSFR